MATESINVLALFAGGGGSILGDQLLGWRTRCAVEIVASARHILLARQCDGLLDPFPIWDDVSTFNGLPWRGSIDVITGGFPCQDISSQGRRSGLHGSRSSLVFEMLRIIGEVRPKIVIAENSPLLSVRGLPEVLCGFAELGYVGCHGVVGARDVGAPHFRDRMWIAAADSRQEVDFEFFRINANRKTTDTGKMRTKRVLSKGAAAPNGLRGLADSVLSCSGYRPDAWWPFDTSYGMDDGLADRMDRVAAVGNGQVPAVVRLVWRTIGAIACGVRNGDETFK